MTDRIAKAIEALEVAQGEIIGMIATLNVRDKESGRPSTDYAPLKQITEALEALRQPSPAMMPRWQPIESAPSLENWRGDILIARFNGRGDCCWVTMVRNPINHHGMTIASHWMEIPEAYFIDREIPVLTNIKTEG